MENRSLILKTVSNCWLGSTVTKHDLSATDLSEILACTSARDDVPEIMPNLMPRFHGCRAHRLSDMLRHMIAAAYVKKYTGKTIDLDFIRTTEDAVTALDAPEESVRRMAGQQGLAVQTCVNV